MKGQVAGYTHISRTCNLLGLHKLLHKNPSPYGQKEVLFYVFAFTYIKNTLFFLGIALNSQQLLRRNIKEESSTLIPRMLFLQKPRENSAFSLSF